MKPIFSLFIAYMLACPVFVLGQTPAEPAASQQTQEAPATTADAATQQPVQQAAQPAPAPSTSAQAVTPQEVKPADKAEPASVSEQKPTEAVSKPVPAADTQAQPNAEQKELEKDLAQATSQEEQPKEEFVAARETVEEEVEPEEEQVVVYNPKSQRDPTLSPDDFLLIQHREQQRLAAIEAERQRKLEEERRKQEEAERLRRLELERIKDPTREVRNKIRIGGVIGQEVFIGSKIYTIGNTIYGARIVAVKPDEVVFSYKGHKFVRKVQL